MIYWGGGGWSNFITISHSNNIMDHVMMRLRLSRWRCEIFERDHYVLSEIYQKITEKLYAHPLVSSIISNRWILRISNFRYLYVFMARPVIQLYTVISIMILGQYVALYTILLNNFWNIHIVMTVFIHYFRLCVCKCEKEKEREGEREREKKKKRKREKAINGCICTCTSIPKIWTLSE